jgi:membrane fusion protein, multidrug efflux system
MPEHEATESRNRRDPSGWIASGLVVALVLWMASALVLPPPQPEEALRPGPPPPAKVAVRASRAETVPQVFVAEGVSHPQRDTELRAEMGGQIAEVEAAKGAELDAGAVILRFDATERAAQLRRAEEEEARARRAYDQAQALLERGVGTVDRVVAARATLAAAEAQLATAERGLDDTVLRAPFAGRLDALEVAAGEFVQPGTVLARLVDLDPLTVRFRVPQQALAQLSPGQPAEIRFITGETRTGTLRFLASVAEPQTRTFAAEVRLDNPDSAIAGGVSAQLRIGTDMQQAHFVSPALLTLSEEGALVVRAVGADDRVEEHAVEIVQARADGVWITGLPETVRLITRGQGFVRAGDTVHPVPEDDP